MCYENVITREIVWFCRSPLKDILEVMYECEVRGHAQLKLTPRLLNRKLNRTYEAS